MKVTAASLLAILCLFLTTSAAREFSTWSNDIESDGHTTVEPTKEKYSTSTIEPTKEKYFTSTVESENADVKLPDYAISLANPKDILLQEIHALDKNVVGQKKDKAKSTTIAPQLDQNSTMTTKVTIKAADSFKKLLEAEDMKYDGRYNGLNPAKGGNKNVDDDDEDDDDDDDEEENIENEYVDEYEYSDDDDDEYVMIQCPDYCRCIGQYAAATTARCTKFVDQQFFGSGIANLQITNAGEIRLGPYSLKTHGLLQLKSIDVTDTRIVELDRTAFDGIPYLFAVNLTRNALQDIHPHTFQNNTQLSLLTISGNPLKHGQYFKGTKHILLDAPTVTDLVFSNNGVTKMPRTAFQKMRSLTYIDLSGNRLREIEKTLFDPLTALVDLNLADNLLNDIPIELFDNSDLESLIVSGNNLSTLAVIRASRLTTLEAARNRIKVIAKDDLSGVPLLDRLVVSSNEMKRIHQHAFANLDQLTHLDVSNNKLNSWTEHHLRTNSRLQVLLMSNNPDLNALPVFKTIGFEYDTFSTFRFECANCGLDDLNPQTFDAMPALTLLNLSKNRISNLPNGLLKSLSTLRDLDLSDNLISSLDANMFRGASSLTKLSLAGNPLVTLQATPFLLTPELSKLDVSRCELERVWSEARTPLKSLRFLSIRLNLLRRITLEELKAMPKISAIDISHNPLDCDQDFHLAIQWLTDHGVTPIERPTHSSHSDIVEFSESDGISKWIDLAKIVCDGIEDGPPSRKLSTQSKTKILFPEILDENTKSSLAEELEDNEDLIPPFDHLSQNTEDIDRAWDQNEYKEYGDYVLESSQYRPWYGNVIWPVLIVIVVTLIVLLLVAHVAISIAKRRGSSPVIRPPMILRQGLVDNKNCGLVYKPLQEEIATPHMPKRGSFYSSSTFHYDKIVPESV